MGNGEWQSPFRAGVGNGEWGMAEPFQGGSGEWRMGNGRALSGREWGVENGEWQNPMDATHALIPYSLLTTSYSPLERPNQST